LAFFCSFEDVDYSDRFGFEVRLGICGVDLEMESKSYADFIPSTLYDQIMRLMPIPSVEAVIVMNDFLLFLFNC